ncbi:toprim domain-containing protein [Stutzerimonas kunmingensis]|uniref:toprim domain-containing protein n=1 Tax=Stutzerimonas kunmingensis TaxID=1211807 RepID=UPI001F35F2D3|nr:toprim domain-containing protein [Stutzerimonas kunmingensis]UIP32551.1 toprim domain-containing protein [Stutzerimonas kunmingensis]
MKFEEIYHRDVVHALENDRELDFQAISDTYLQKGLCPSCGKRRLFISRKKPFQLKCNRDNECQFEQKTRERYAHLFENLSERFPKTEANPNATADAYLQRNRGFDTSKLQGWYSQARRKMADGSWADTVRFPLCDGYWERIIDASAVARNDGDKAGIKGKMSYTSQGWVPPGQVINKGDRVYIVEGIFHAIALHLAGYKVIASISCVNFPWDIVEENRGKLITWCIGLDDDPAGRKYIPKYLKQLKELNEIGWVALAGERDWDDVYRDGELNDAFLEEACYRGRLFTARSPMKVAYLLYMKGKRSFFLLDYENRLYSARINVAELQKDLDGDEVDGHYTDFAKHCTVAQVANCVPEFEYIQRDAITGDQQYFFQFRFPNAQQDCKVPLAPSAVGEPRSFAKAMLERTPGGDFQGGERVLAMLRGRWLENAMTVRTLPFVGYDEETGTYVFQQFGYRKGREYQANRHGFLDVGRSGLKTSLNSFRVVHGQDFKPDWFADFLAVNHLNGVGALSWWTGCLFVQQIRQRQGSWPFFEFTGEAGAGKSFLLRFLWCLVGRPNQEGVKPNSEGSTSVGLIRAFSQVSNLPVVLIESDTQTIDAQGRVVVNQYNWEKVKPLYDHNATLRTVGVKSSSNDTDSLIFRGALCMSQNASVEGHEAIMTRIVHMHATKEHHTPQLKAVSIRLKDRPVEELAGYLRHCLENEAAWLQRYFEAFPVYEKRLQENSAIRHQRIVHCHAQMMAAAHATQAFFPDWSDRTLDQLLKHIEGRAVDRQQRVSKEDTIASRFWQIFHYLNERVVTVHESGEAPKEITQETLNHSGDKGLIAINIEHFHNACRLAGQEVIPAVQLMRALPLSTTYRFLENRKVRSVIEKRSLNCWVFARGNWSC